MSFCTGIHFKVWLVSMLDASTATFYYQKASFTIKTHSKVAVYSDKIKYFAQI